jgi:hypothetical protein
VETRPQPAAPANTSIAGTASARATICGETSRPIELKAYGRGVKAPPGGPKAAPLGAAGRDGTTRIRPAPRVKRCSCRRSQCQRRARGASEAVEAGRTSSSGRPQRGPTKVKLSRACATLRFGARFSVCFVESEIGGANISEGLAGTRQLWDSSGPSAKITQSNLRWSNSLLVLETIAPLSRASVPDRRPGADPPGRIAARKPPPPSRKIPCQS